MSPFKPGLHKKISSIFEGVPITKHGDSREVTNSGKHPADEPRSGFTGGKEQRREEPSRLEASQGMQNFLKEQANEASSKSSRNLYKDAAEKNPKVSSKTEKKTKRIVLSFADRLKNKLLSPKPGVNRNRQIVSFILIPVLCIVLMVVLVKVFGSGPARKKVSSKAKETSTAVESSKQIIWQVPKPVSANLRDPMRADSSPGRDLPGFGDDFAGEGEVKLMGIVHSSERPLAIINQQIIGEGGKLGDYTAVKINEHTVEIEKGGQRKTLKVGQRWLTSE